MGHEEEMSHPAGFREAESQVCLAFQACATQLPHPGWDGGEEEALKALGTDAPGQHPLGPTFPDMLCEFGICFSLSGKAQMAHSTSWWCQGAGDVCRHGDMGTWLDSPLCASPNFIFRYLCPQMVGSHTIAMTYPT